MQMFQCSGKCFKKYAPWDMLKARQYSRGGRTYVNKNAINRKDVPIGELGHISNHDVSQWQLVDLLVSQHREPRVCVQLLLQTPKLLLLGPVIQGSHQHHKDNSCQDGCSLDPSYVLQGHKGNSHALKSGTVPWVPLSSYYLLLFHSDS